MWFYCSDSSLNEKSALLLYPDNYLNKFHFVFLYINAINPIRFAHPASTHHPSVPTSEQQIEFALCENLCLQNFIRKQIFSPIGFESTKRFPRAGFILRCIFIQEVSLFPVLALQDRPHHFPHFRAVCSALLSNSALCRWCSDLCTHQNMLYWCSAYAFCKLCFCFCPWVTTDRSNWDVLENVLAQILKVASFQKKTKWSWLWSRSPMMWWVDCW